MRRALPLLCLTLVVACVDPEVAMDPADDTLVEFEVPKGSTAKRIAPDLVDKGLVPSEFKWNWFASGDEAACLKAGRFHLKRSMSMREILTTLCGVPLPDDVPFTVLEGWRIVDIDAALVAKGWIEPGAYAAIARDKKVEAPFEVTSPSYEGYLYPETYMVPPKEGFSAERLVARQLAIFNERFVVPHANDLGARSLHDVVVLASLLEREEPAEAQRPIVAGLLWKRLDHGWQLGVDATSRYGLDDWTNDKAFRVRLKDPDDPYNTRIHKGLPPTAIGNPTLSALEAAITPEESEFWFYLHDRKGVFHGARTGDEHEANRKTYNIY